MRGYFYIKRGERDRLKILMGIVRLPKILRTIDNEDRYIRRMPGVPKAPTDNEAVLRDLRTSNCFMHGRVKYILLREESYGKGQGMHVAAGGQDGSATLAFTGEATIIVKRDRSTIPHPPLFHP